MILYRRPTLFGWTIIGSAAGFIIGGALLIWGLTLPPYSDHALAMQEWNSWCAGGTSRGAAQQAAADRYYALMTWRYPLVDTGLNLILAACTVAGIAYSLCITRAAAWSWLRTPKSRSSFVLIGLGVLALNLMGWSISLYVDLDRVMFPWCADSIGIPLEGLVTFTIAAAAVVVPLGILITQLFGELPVSLLYWDSDRRLRSWGVTIAFMLIAAPLALAVAIQFPTSSYLSVCGGVVALYLAAATRAALLAPPARSEPTA
ncbi:hypothetical protein [Stakelama marina]|uniref:Uncharacterized protein n=1 Tax=Stakelama marina TaxID=2826939 RepID=A0A8T4IHV1_9SPHN|nr:hypothetical protein [Stakelama marina]MBR0552665.1 hypothetical protein [Stakelama marina]